jgi:hypothetical protein
VILPFPFPQVNLPARPVEQLLRDACYAENSL